MDDYETSDFRIHCPQRPVKGFPKSLVSFRGGWGIMPGMNERSTDPGLPRPPGRPRSESARKSILESAYRLLREKGIHGTSTMQIAAEAGVSTATLYRWWDTKEAVLLDALVGHVRPQLDFRGKGPPLRRLRDQLARGARFLASGDGRVLARVIAGVQEDPALRKQFLERYYLPRRALAEALVEEAIRDGVLPRGTDPEVVVDALHGPLMLRLFLGHAPITPRFARQVADRVLGTRGRTRPKLGSRSAGGATGRVGRA
jgi:AcrR family transcriptional regulator